MLYYERQNQKLGPDDNLSYQSGASHQRLNLHAGDHAACLWSGGAVPRQSANGDWTDGGHQQRTPGDNFGNQMIGFGGGADGNAQIPVMYAVGPNSANY